MGKNTSALSDPALLLQMVCGRATAGDPRYYPQADYRGLTVYFCTEFCLNAFLADPDRFFQVHSRQLNRTTAGETPPNATR